MSGTRIGVNLLWLAPGRVGGSEESTVASLLALRERAEPGLVVTLFATPALARAHPHLVAAFPHELSAPAERSRAARIVVESTWLATRTRGLDLVHHVGGTAPAARTCPYVLTIHDLQPLERTATHGRLKRAYLSVAIPRSVAGARRVVVPSDFVRRSLVDRFGVDPARVATIPHGVATGPATPEEDLRERFRLPGPVVLYPAIAYPHKNHSVLVSAFALVSGAHPAATLVLTGGPGAEDPALEAQIAALGLSDRVRRTGRVPAADVAGLYRLAHVVAVPSRYEGFGLPAAEAMAYGAPVVAADATALPEVVGDAGVLVDPDDVEGWGAALDRLLADQGERLRLSDAGRERARRYSWEANAEALAALYREAAAGT